MFSFAFLLISSITAEPSPPFSKLSSIVITFFVFSIDFKIVSSSNGFKNLAFIISIFFSAN